MKTEIKTKVVLQHQLLVSFLNLTNPCQEHRTDRAKINSLRKFLWKNFPLKIKSIIFQDKQDWDLLFISTTLYFKPTVEIRSEYVIFRSAYQRKSTISVFRSNSLEFPSVQNILFGVRGGGGEIISSKVRVIINWRNNRTPSRVTFLYFKIWLLCPPTPNFKIKKCYGVTASDYSSNIMTSLKPLNIWKPLLYKY